jgi:hypothetical protein
MPNLTNINVPQVQPWNSRRFIRTPAATPAAQYTLYGGAAQLRDASGNIINCDDTAKGEFVGFLFDIVRPVVGTDATVQTNGIAGDFELNIEQPVTYNVIFGPGNAAGGMEGLKVYWQFNNQVQLIPGVNGNYAGTIWQVLNATTVKVLAPWAERAIGGGSRGMMSPTPAASIILTKWDVNRTFRLTGTISQTITLPPLASVSSDDAISFIYDSASAQQITIKGNAAETINGSNTMLMGTTRYSKATFKADIVTPQWLQAV